MLSTASITRAAVARKRGVHVDEVDSVAAFRLPRTALAGMTGLGETARAIGTNVETLREVLDLAALQR